MKIPLSWLKTYLPALPSPPEIAEKLTLAGIEVDTIETIRPSFEGVVAATVLEVAPHPNADHLRVAQVSDGTSHLQIVCGASNCRAGIRVALARVGAHLTDKDGKSWKIKKSRLRSVDSEGMLCSAEELGLTPHSEGIIELEETWTEGTPLAPFYEETILEISLTPNLGHCLSLLGIARELSALFDLPLKKPETHCQEKGISIREAIKVSIQSPEECARYCCRLVTDVTVAPSPSLKWILPISKPFKWSFWWS